MVSKMIFRTLLAVVFALGLMTFSFAGDREDRAKFERFDNFDRFDRFDTKFDRERVFNNRFLADDFEFEEDFNFIRVNPFFGFTPFVRRPIVVVGDD